MLICAARGALLSLALAAGKQSDVFDGYACVAKGSDRFPFCDTTLGIDVRVDDLVSRINLSAIGAQLTARESPAISELGIPDYYWGTNAVHNIREFVCHDGRCPTSFPAPPAFAASFNMSLVRDMGRMIASELRAGYNIGLRFTEPTRNLTHRIGLNTWSPTLNIARDPRWGRNMESPGEDPYLNAMYGKAYSEGAQGSPEHALTAVTLKHWVAYSLEDYNGTSRHTFDAKVSAYDLASTYYPVHEAAVKESKVMGLMCSYNMLNGLPTCGNPALHRMLREDWGFDGYVSSDTDACADISETHLYAMDIDHAVGLCLAGGTDINSGNTYKDNLAHAVETNAAARGDAMTALRNALKIRFRLGLFDPFAQDDRRSIPWEVVGSERHQASSLLAAKQGMTLLKNKGEVLPFRPNASLAVIGTGADDNLLILGNYNQDNVCLPGRVFNKNPLTINTTCVPTLWEELKSRVSAAGGRATLVSEKTGAWDAPAISRALDAAGAADQVLVFVSNVNPGGDPIYGGWEDFDAVSIALEPSQRRMVEAVLNARAGLGKSSPSPTALVLVNGGPIGFDEVLEEAPAILQAWMPGVHGGRALSETVFGDNNPSGKLPVTVHYSNYTEQSDFLSMSMTDGPGRTYRYLAPDFPVAFRFGHGLSYTSFALGWAGGRPPVLALSSRADVAAVEVQLTNTGAVPGDEVVQVFVRPSRRPETLDSTAPVILRQLAAFERVHAAVGAAVRVRFEVSAEAFALADSSGDVKLHGGDYSLVLSRGHGPELEAEVKVDVRAPVMLKPFRKWWADSEGPQQGVFV